MTTQKKSASLTKLVACFIYDALVVIALCFACGYAFLWLVGDGTHGLKRYALQLILFCSVGAYFIWCWLKTGQTVAMQTWQLKLVDQNNQLLSIELAVARYVLASVGLMLFGLGFFWAIFDSKSLFLHDRLLKTHIIYVPRNKAL